MAGKNNVRAMARNLEALWRGQLDSEKTEARASARAALLHVADFLRGFHV